jgi:hypothetical protein
MSIIPFRLVRGSTLTSTRPLGLLCAGFAPLLLGDLSVAQCPNWILTPSAHSPFRGWARSVAAWTPPGASTPRLFVGGSPHQWYRGQYVGAVSQWNGSHWTPTGDNLGGPVNALVVWNSPAGPRLVAGGDFSSSGFQTVRRLAMWDGVFWQEIGGGVSAGGEVLALTVWDPDGPGSLVPRLVVGGRFDSAGQLGNTKNIASWDGVNWHPFHLGFNSGTVLALTTWDPDGAGSNIARLIVGGNFTTEANIPLNGIAQWSGGTIGFWQPMGTGMSSSITTPTIRALEVWDPDGPGVALPRLAAAGTFTHAGGVPAHGVASWDGGSWSGFDTSAIWGTALTTWDPDGAGPDFPRLVIAGDMYQATQLVPMPRYWNGTSWQAVGQFGNGRYVEDFASWDPDGAGPLSPRLVAAGRIHENTPGGMAGPVMQLVGPEWNNVTSSTPQVFAATTFSGRLVMGGVFEMMGNPQILTDTADVRNLTAWNGFTHTSLGTVSGAVRALKAYTILGSSQLIVGGSFSSAGGVGANRIARYSESISVLNSGWFAMGSGFNSTVLAIERFNNATYAGGVFTASGGTTVNRIARFDGTNWQPLGTGMNGNVNALKAYNGSLYAGGSFTTAGGLSSGGLARWDGTNWNVVGGFFNGTVWALEVWNNLLIIGGSFAGLAGSPNIAAYNGSSYFNLGSGGTGVTSTPVRAIAVGPDGHLYIGGQFSTAGGVGANNFARWNGSSSWSDVHGGVLAGPVHAIATYRNELHVGGEFTKARWGELATPAWARFSVDGIPWIAIHPRNAHASCPGQTLLLEAAAATGYEVHWPYDLQWRKGGVPIVLGVQPWGSTLALGPSWPWYNLQVQNIRNQDAGEYDLFVTNACGSGQSATALVSVCYANCDCSSTQPILNVEDFTCFINAFATGISLPHAEQLYHYANCNDSATPPVLNVEDFTCFINAFAAGCP